jgi:mannose-6-phosphate isomerase-like protein (cupin superfamily)
MQDFGKKPYVVNIEELTITNSAFRTVAWTGSNMQMTLMAIQPGDDIGLEVHDDHDQFLRIEQGNARIIMGDSRDDLTFDVPAEEDFAIFVPAGKWHNVVNTGADILKLYSIYAPSEHPFGAIHQTKADAEIAEAAQHEQ